MASLPQNRRFDSAIHIRQAGREDLDTLFALDQMCFRPGIAYSMAELRYFLFHARSASIVADDSTGILGFAIVQFGLAQGRSVGHIITIDVDPSLRRNGVGRALMGSLLNLCGQHEAALLRLEVAVDNDPAIAFYREFGFRETGRIPGFYIGRIDALTMERELSSHCAT
ncbi:MAG TPA: N-acetyltransferase [Acidobacteriaceae bacterium]|nr:N-acetyltransferase [Acidobacteriaceae bacterium]